ncbi:hypothetical protein LP52_23875 [Streptomonospora alba]|uniref:DUF4287 domain-containing protein n=1 Tax=Streptomonospora alba TaxID=183763 RepID=A0A0C2J5G7_9ACTN|nr:hypothetical protein [Streptomonospora alba]KIH96611.1 hypothetical protein LP52_23875 [Streptomonospora alba]
MAENAHVEPIERATGRTWDTWLRFMAGIGAPGLDHRTIALRVSEELAGTVDNPGWWAQSVTVAYERHIGRRVPGQRADGTFETSVSRSTKLGMRELMDAWVEFAADDREVLDLVAADARVGGTEKRMTWRTKAADGSSVLVTSEPGKDGSASIVATRSGLASPEANAEAKARWSAIVNRFLESV